MLMTSPQNAVRIGWEYAGGVCLNHFSECFASAGAKQTIQEWVNQMDGTGDPILDAMTPIPFTLMVLLSFLSSSAMDRLVTALENPPTNEVHHMKLTSPGPSHDGVRVSDQRSPCETRFWSAPIVACSTPAHAHVDDPFQYLSCGLGLHRKSGLSEVIGNGGT